MPSAEVELGNEVYAASRVRLRSSDICRRVYDPRRRCDRGGREAQYNNIQWRSIYRLFEIPWYRYTAIFV